ncbi:hypothetical protein [Fodinicola feengrottensis]|uniref:Uncharacterized protein n=1 Tax=Fodinicola feengrottensis TaxID=435914 RepID=A0ABN2FRK3_9ACTN|nr:hypothetical protein [Fodinicola feengrottensis]
MIYDDLRKAQAAARGSRGTPGRDEVLPPLYRQVEALVGLPAGRELSLVKAEPKPALKEDSWPAKGAPVQPAAAMRAEVS